MGPGAPAPYNIPADGATQSPYEASRRCRTWSRSPTTRLGWCEFYRKGRLSAEPGNQSVFENGDRASDIGYWNLMFDQLGGEGYDYTADANGYTSNVINWNSADAFNSNNEFSPGNQYKTLTHGYSSMFTALFDAIEKLAEEKGVVLNYRPDTRLHSIYQKGRRIHFGIATRAEPWRKAESRTADAAWLAMPRNAIELVAQATRYAHIDGLDVLNGQKVQLYLEAAIMQPSYKIGLFFDSPMVARQRDLPAEAGRLQHHRRYAGAAWRGGLAASGPARNEIRRSAGVRDRLRSRKMRSHWRSPTASTARWISPSRASCWRRRSSADTIGPAFTDTPIRMCVYFGNNALDQNATPVHGMLASYDDEQFATFWKELEVGPGQAGDHSRPMRTFSRWKDRACARRSWSRC